MNRKDLLNKQFDMLDKFIIEKDIFDTLNFTNYLSYRYDFAKDRFFLTDTRTVGVRTELTTNDRYVMIDLLLEAVDNGDMELLYIERSLMEQSL